MLCSFSACFSVARPVHNHITPDSHICFLLMFLQCQMKANQGWICVHLLTLPVINNKGLPTETRFWSTALFMCHLLQAALSHRRGLEQLSQMGSLRGKEGHPNLLLEWELTFMWAEYYLPGWICLGEENRLKTQVTDCWYTNSFCLHNKDIKTSGK